MNQTIHLIGTTELLSAIATPANKRRDVAALYAVSLRLNFGQTDYEAVNQAIEERWLLAGLKWIKRLAWRAVEESESDHGQQARPRPLLHQGWLAAVRRDGNGAPDSGALAMTQGQGICTGGVR